MHRAPEVKVSRRGFIGTVLALSAAVVLGRVAGELESVHYTFYDDFNGPAGSVVDPTKWVYDQGAGGWGNEELEYYTKSPLNSYVDGDSNLVIAATTDGQGHYWSARLKTLGRFSQLGGHFEARIKHTAQLGIWPAFWLLGQDMPVVGWPKCGEVDGYESFGYNTSIQSSVYTPSNIPGQVKYGAHAATSGDGAWHVYRVDVEETGVTFSIDSNVYGHVPASYCPPESWVFGPGEPNNGGLFILLNVAVGGAASQSPPPASTVFPAVMLVDWVRAWK